MINIQNQQTFPIDLAQLEHNAKIVMATLDYPDFDLGIEIVDPATMQIYNRDYRDKDRPTDILSFPYHPQLKAGQRIVPENEDEQNLGDIILCPQYIFDDLPNWEGNFAERMQVLLIHGICHLLGYDHIEDHDYEIMHKVESQLLEKLRTQTSV